MPRGATGRGGRLRGFARIRICGIGANRACKKALWDDIHRVRHRSKRIDSHPRQLPIHLMERLLMMTTDESDAALDPFCGGGEAAGTRVHRH